MEFEQSEEENKNIHEFNDKVQQLSQDETPNQNSFEFSELSPSDNAHDQEEQDLMEVLGQENSQDMNLSHDELLEQNHPDKNADHISDFVHDIAGEGSLEEQEEEEDIEEEEDEQLEEDLKASESSSLVENLSKEQVDNLPDMESKGEVAKDGLEEGQDNSLETEGAPDQEHETITNKESDQGNKQDNENQEQLEQQEQQDMPPPIQQTTLGSGIGHAFGSIVNGVFGALATGIAAANATKNALSSDLGSVPSNKMENKVELGAHAHFNLNNSIEKSVDNSFTTERVEQWKQSRIESEFGSLSTDISMHAAAMDRLTKTEWAAKLKAIELNGDTETKINAPKILGALKKKVDFVESNRDMNYFADHIQMRAEKLAANIKDDQSAKAKLESVLESWHENAKKKLDELPDSAEKTGFLEKIKNGAQKIMAVFNSVFGKSASMR